MFIISVSQCNISSSQTSRVWGVKQGDKFTYRLSYSKAHIGQTNYTENFVSLFATQNFTGIIFHDADEFTLEVGETSHGGKPVSELSGIVYYNNSQIHVSFISILLIHDINWEAFFTNQMMLNSTLSPNSSITLYNSSKIIGYHLSDQII